MNMDPMINELLGVLEQESGLYRSMLKVIDQESKAAVRSDFDALTKVGEEKENILQKLRLIEDKRTELISEMAAALGYPQQALTLSLISQQVGEPFAGRLRQAGTDLSTVLNTVRKANQQTRQLFEHSLELLKSSFNLLSNLTQSDTVYRPSGNMQRTPPSGKCINGDV